MILQGNQRGGARNLAQHLVKEENEHVEIHEIRGFVSEDLQGALSEAYAVSRGTKAKQYLYSLSLNPPPSEKVSTASFEDAINRSEATLGLEGQPRAVIFHEKNGRRHAHCVWSRIDAKDMKAIQLSFTKRKLMELSKELYVEHGWEMPAGMRDWRDRNPTNYTLAEWQQAKRQGKDAARIKAEIQSCWSRSDDKQSFEAALMDKGYILARGDKRGFVAIDYRAEIYSITRQVGISAKEVRQRLGDPADLPSVQEGKEKIAMEMGRKLKTLEAEEQHKIQTRLAQIKEKRRDLVQKQKKQRVELKRSQESRWERESDKRQRRFTTGTRGILQKLTGAERRIKEQNQRESYLALLRDREERDALILSHLDERQSLDARKNRLGEYSDSRKRQIGVERQQYEEIKRKERDHFTKPDSGPRRNKGPELAQ